MTARAIGDVTAAFVQYRNPDRTNVPRRNSYDVDDRRARVFVRICDGSKAQGRAWRAAKLETVKAWIHRQWMEHYDGPHKLRRIDRFVLEALLSFVNYATGELYPCYKSIAREAGVSRAAVAQSLQRLRFHKLIDWVRRTVTADTAGEMGPQREQTSNAYHFGCERQMEPRARQYFLMALARNLAKLGGAARAKVRAPEPTPPLDPGTQAVFDRMEATLLKQESASPQNGLYPGEGI
ncbi:MAG: hypothetical protein BGP16_00245 [Sphingobium sp. 66-54]|nr:MAG: hypothetical protein BGP16_00245 [Sphingobium sp. 66-54]